MSMVMASLDAMFKKNLIIKCGDKALKLITFYPKINLRKSLEKILFLIYNFKEQRLLKISF